MSSWVNVLEESADDEQTSGEEDSNGVRGGGLCDDDVGAQTVKVDGCFPHVEYLYPCYLPENCFVAVVYIPYDANQDLQDCTPVVFFLMFFSCRATTACCSPSR